MLQPRRDALGVAIGAAANDRNGPNSAVQGRRQLFDPQIVRELMEVLGSDGFTGQLARFQTEAHAGFDQLEALAGPGQTTALTAMAHKMKGAASMFGAIELAGLLQRLHERPGTAASNRKMAAAGRKILEETLAELAVQCGSSAQGRLATQGRQARG